MHSITVSHTHQKWYTGRMKSWVRPLCTLWRFWPFQRKQSDRLLIAVDRGTLTGLYSSKSRHMFSLFNNLFSFGLIIFAIWPDFRAIYKTYRPLGLAYSRDCKLYIELTSKMTLYFFRRRNCGRSLSEQWHHEFQLFHSPPNLPNEPSFTIKPRRNIFRH